MHSGWSIVDRLAEVASRPDDESLGQGAELAFRPVAEHEVLVVGRVELEVGQVGAGVELADLGVDDVVEREQERPVPGCGLEERRVTRSASSGMAPRPGVRTTSSGGTPSAVDAAPTRGTGRRRGSCRARCTSRRDPRRRAASPRCPARSDSVTTSSTRLKMMPFIGRPPRIVVGANDATFRTTCPFRTTGPADAHLGPDTLERLRAGRVKLHLRQSVLDRVTDVGGDEHLAALGRLGDPRGHVDGVADDVVAGDDDVADVGAGPKPQRRGLGLDQLEAGEHRRLRLGEREQQPVAEPLDHPATAAAHDGAHGAVVRGSSLLASSSPFSAVNRVKPSRSVNTTVSRVVVPCWSSPSLGADSTWMADRPRLASSDGRRSTDRSSRRSMTSMGADVVTGPSPPSTQSRLTTPTSVRLDSSSGSRWRSRPTTLEATPRRKLSTALRPASLAGEPAVALVVTHVVPTVPGTPRPLPAALGVASATPGGAGNGVDSMSAGGWR